MAPGNQHATQPSQKAQRRAALPASRSPRADCQSLLPLCPIGTYRAHSIAPIPSRFDELHFLIDNHPTTKMVERADSLVPYGDEREWFACLMWIFRHASRNLIRTWYPHAVPCHRNTLVHSHACTVIINRWKKDAQKRHAALLRLLTSCLGVFDVRSHTCSVE
jgi:hypothetical protein